jgi:mono/diheme cytochrome c family protein
MGAIAVLHVFISHFAIGGGLYLVVTEHCGRKCGDESVLLYLQKLSKFFVLVSLVMGALTGVAIWFIIGLLNPTATEVLIHNYVWGWAIEWTFFVVEIAAAIIYYYGWKRMTARAHLTVGWIYFVSAWLSLFIINGIITFMLTPGDWMETGAFWDGFFNPTFWPSLVMRTGICIMLAGLYALLVLARYPGDAFKARMVRYSAGWGLLGLVVTGLSQLWYWRAIPVNITMKALETMPTPTHSWHGSFGLAMVIAVLLLLGVALGKRWTFAVSVVLMVAGLAWFGSFEMFRESVRKPYAIHGYIYGNGLEVAKEAQYKADGLTPQLTFRTGNDGADLFRHACRSCHTVDGYKPLKPAFDGTDRDFIAAIVKSTHLLRGNMAPFLGTEEEAGKIAAYLRTQVDQRTLAEICAERGVDLGKTAYDIRCGKCHEVGKASDKSKSFAGMSMEEISGLLDMGSALGAGMPDYTGDKTERAALVAYLQLLGKQVTK